MLLEMRFVLVFSSMFVCVFGRYVNEAGNSNILKKCTDGFQEFTDCVKFKAITFLDNALVNRKPIPLASFLYLTHDDATNGTENLVDDEEEALKSADVDDKLNELLVRRVRRLVSTKNLQIKLDAAADSSAEGRKKKEKDKGSMMVMMGAGAMMMHAMMSKIAFIAGKALIIAKIALVISALMGMKKMMSQDEHESTQVVYKQEAASGGGGGGWHRSIDNPESAHAHRMAYGGQVHHES